MSVRKDKMRKVDLRARTMELATLRRAVRVRRLRFRQVFMVFFLSSSSTTDPNPSKNALST